MDFIHLPPEDSNLLKEYKIRGQVLSLINSLEILIKQKIASSYFKEQAEQEEFISTVLDLDTINFSSLTMLLIRVLKKVNIKENQLESLKGKLIQVGKLRNKLVHGYITFYYNKGIVEKMYINHNSDESDLDEVYRVFEKLSNEVTQVILKSMSIANYGNEEIYNLK